MPNTHTVPPWIIDDGMVQMEDQAVQLMSDRGTAREWIAIGVADKEGFAEVVALCHPDNAPVIAAAPDLLAELEKVLADVDAGNGETPTTSRWQSAHVAINKARTTV